MSANSLNRQIVFITGGPWSVTFSDIYMVKMENYVVTPLKPKLCQ